MPAPDAVTPFPIYVVNFLRSQNPSALLVNGDRGLGGTFNVADPVLGTYREEVRVDIGHPRTHDSAEGND